MRKHGVDRHLKLRTQVTKASWASEEAKWHVSIFDLETKQHAVVTADFFISATGRLNHAAFPDIEGLENFAGPVIHTANWDSSFDYSNRTLAVIGNGASGMQLIPNILADVGHIDHFVRSRTWVSPFFRQGLLTVSAENPGGHEYTAEKRHEFATDKAAYLEYRKSLDVKFHGPLRASISGSAENAALRRLLTDLMSDRVGNDERLLQKILPDYAPGCKRLTPAPGYLESLKDPKVNYITERIVRATASGLVTADGKEHPVEAIIAATGFSDSYIPRFPMIGLNGVNIQDQWALDGPIGYPETYFGVMAPDFPNLFFVLQVQGTAGGGTVPMQCEITATYIAKCIRKIQSQSYSALAPRQDATDDFNAVVEGFFDDKVSMDTCHSWWKVGQGRTRNVVSWPGTGQHKVDISRDPRWEDFVFQRRPGAERNRFEYFGNGVTKKEEEGDPEKLTRYLKEVGAVDLRTVHELWTEQD